MIMKKAVKITALLPVLLLLLAGCGDTDKMEKLRGDRAQLRLYDGAPPVIPHDVDEIGRRDCLSCHEEGKATLNGKFAAITPHPSWTNCKQCHVPQQDVSLFQKNSFIGVEYHGGIQKANPVGPP